MGRHFGILTLVVSSSDCGVRGPRFESNRGRLCLLRRPVRYAVLGTGCAPLLQCHCQGQVVNLALHPSGVAKSSTNFGWGKGGNVISVVWQVTLCDPIWHVSFRSGVAMYVANCYIRTIRYDTRCYFNARSKADMSQLNLPHGTNNYTVTVT